MLSSRLDLLCSLWPQQPIQLINSNIEVAKAGRIPGGKTEIPFEFPLSTKGNKVLYETYHGVFVNIQVTSEAFLLSGIVLTIILMVQFKMGI